MNKSVKRLLKLILVIIILCFFGSIVNSITGNPISAALATARIKEYVAETYPELDLEVPKAKYNLKYSDYYSIVKSKISKDTYFSVSYARGRFTDGYEYAVENCYNTFSRLANEFSKTVEELISKEFPYETSILFADFLKSDEASDKLTLDMELDMSNPPLPATIVIYITNKEVSYEFLSSRLVELSELMERHQIPITTYSMVVEEPIPVGEKAASDGKTLYLYDFPAEKIEDEGLIDRMKEHQREWESANEK